MASRIVLLLACVVAFAFGGCKHDSVVVVYADCDTTTLDPPLSITNVRAIVTNGSSNQEVYFPSSSPSVVELGFPATFALVIPPGHSGVVAVTLEGLDDQGYTLAYGTAAASLRVGERTNLYVVLEPGGWACGDGKVGEDEGCDDGNRIAGDGCDPACRPEAGGPSIKHDGGVRDGGRDVQPIDGGTQDGPGVTVSDSAPLVGSAFVSVAAGTGFSCAARHEGALYCWGDNSEQQVGSSADKEQVLAPRQLTGTRWQSVSSGQNHACALDSMDLITCWGRADSGQLGKSVTSGQKGTVQLADADWESVGAGSCYSCGKKRDNTVWCWGQNFSGQLGLGVAGPQETYVPMRVSDDASWAMLSVGSMHACATKADGSLWCWGSNAASQIGDGTQITAFAPVQVPGKEFASVSAGGGHTCATYLDGTLACWGGNDAGQLGDGTTRSKGVPTPLPEGDWAFVAAGAAHTCAIKTDGSLWCWGDNSAGQLGDGTLSSRVQPTKVVGVTEAWTRVSPGAGHTCGSVAGGSLYCWGNNAKGQLGDGTTSNRNKPALIAR